MPRSTDLSSGWSLTLVQPAPDAPDELRGRRIPADVPGCVHTDLLTAGLLEDPYLDDNEDRQHWIGRSAWLYESTFEGMPDEGERVDLVADGLDTVATVSVNGIEVGRSANMHRSYRFDVTGRHCTRRQQPAGRAVRVGLDLRRADAGPAGRPGRRCYPTPYNFIRKMACSFGWDWGPTWCRRNLAARACTWYTARLVSVRPQDCCRGGPDGARRCAVKRTRSRSWTASAGLGRRGLGYLAVAGRAEEPRWSR